MNNLVSMKATFWGTRGSLPAPGPDTTRYGGNTSCVSVESVATGHTLVLDAGSGVRLAGQLLASKPGRVDVLLTHLHMDHIQGLGFFLPLFQPGREVHVWGPPSTTRTLRRRLARYLSPPLFPVRLRELASKLTCHDVTEEPWEIDGFRISASLVSHPDPTLGYRIESDGRVFTYLPDHEPQLGSKDGRLPRAQWLSGFRVAEGADFLVHDGQYTDDEYRTRVGWGHCTPGLALRFAETVGARRLCLFHHDPAHSDELLDGIFRAVSSAYEGDVGLQIAREAQTVLI